MIPDVGLHYNLDMLDCSKGTKEEQQSRAPQHGSFGEDLDNLKLRHVSTEIGGKGREVIRVKSSKSDADLSARSARSAERSFSVRCNYSDTSSLVDQEDSIEECDIDDLLQPLPTLPAKAEAYEDGQMVLYWSQSLGQSAAAVIVGKGTFFSGLDKSSFLFALMILWERFPTAQVKSRCPSYRLVPPLRHPGVPVVSKCRLRYKPEALPGPVSQLSRCQVPELEAR